MSKRFSHPSWLNVPNALSLSRLLLTPFVACAVLDNSLLFAATGFFLVVVSDIADGLVARRYGSATRIGTLIDHVADAVFVVTLTTTYAHLGLFPWALPVLIAVAFVQYALDSGSAVRHGPRPSRLGKANGIAYFAIVGVAISLGGYLDYPFVQHTVTTIAWLLIASTFVSILARAKFAVAARPSSR